MPKKSKEEYNAYMKVYMLERYHAQRAKAVEALGGKCVKCGATENLEIDHIDQKAKSFDVAKAWSKTPEAFQAEIAKCQLLCKSCHEDKTIVDLDFKKAKGSHGTLSTRRYCKCQVCRDAFNGYMREWKAKKRKLAKDGAK